MTSSPYREVVVGTDGSATATTAVRIAASLASAMAARLSIVTVWQRDRDDAPPTSGEALYPGGSAASNEASWATTTTSDAAAVARTLGVEDVRQLTPPGDPAEALIDVAAGTDGALIVVGTAGLDSRAERLLGNVPHQLTHNAPGDLLLVDSSRSRDGLDWRTVALATDGSPTAANACRKGVEFARAFDAELHLVTVARDGDAGRRTLEQAVQELGLDGVEHRVLDGGDAGGALVEHGGRYDLLVLGNKGMSGPARLLGSVANKVTHGVPTDLLLVNTTR